MGISINDKYSIQFGYRDQVNPKNLSSVISPVIFERFRHDMQMWREACTETEQGMILLRHRVRMQRMFLDTVLNEHIEACIKKRKRQITQKAFTVNEDDDLTAIFKKPWFTNFLSYVIDAPLYGYTLITLGDVIDNEFKELSFVKRQNVSPDRKQVSTFVYSMSGTDFEADEYKPWHIWIPTPTETAASPCGYGLLYKIAKTEILLRNNTAYNADFNEMYGQPIRKGTTTKQGEERDEFFAALVEMAHNGAILLDDGQDVVDLLESKSAGSGWQGFSNFEKRLEDKISKVLLGHADALDSVPGKLGSTQGDDSPAAQALAEVEQDDTVLCEAVVNNELIPRMIELGFPIPVGAKLSFSNNAEKQEIRKKEDLANKGTADIAYTMKQAGLTMDSKYFEDRTGIVTTVAPVADVVPFNKPFGAAAKAKLKSIYRKKKDAV